MNERIQELAERAGMTNFPTSGVSVLYGVESIEKFAQLIVQECINVSTKRSLHYEDHGDTDKSGAAGSVGLLIAEHFGVK